MLTPPRLAVASLVLGVLLAGLTVQAAQAAAVPKVSGVANAGQNWPGATLKVKWRAVAKATYQVRWASRTALLARAKPVASRTTSVTTPRLGNRCIPWYVQVRAVKAGKVGPWSAAKALRFSNKLAVVPAVSTTTQTSSGQAQVRWSAAAYDAKFRLHWSPAPFGKWPGFDPSTAWYPQSARVGAIALPAIGPGDRFMNVAYGNPVFAQMQVSNGCTSSVRQGTYVPVWPKPADPGASTGDPLAIGSYNVENMPTFAANGTKVSDLADNIASQALDVVALQEASYQTASDLATRLARAFNQPDWKVVGSGNRNGVAQQVIYRSGRYTETRSGLLGQADDDVAATPLLTPWAELAPVAPRDPKSQSIMVMSVHLEESTSTSQVTKKQAAHNAAAALLSDLARANTAHLPVVAAGDFKGNFQAYCDEKSSPACPPEGQPTFIRTGDWYDAQAAVTKVGIAYGTVNKHVADQPANLSGFGGRADYILLSGFTGSSRYAVVRKTYGNGSATYQSDHNLITADVYVPHAP